MFKRIAAIFVVVVMLVALLAACDSTPAETQPEDPPANEEVTTPAEDPPEDPAEDPEEPEEPAVDGFAGYPMNAMDQTLTFYTWQPFGFPDTLTTWEESPFLTGLNEAVGVNIEWIFPVAGAADQLQDLNLMIASGDLPDIIANGVIMPDAEILMDEGVIRDLAPYLAAYAPNYYAFLQEHNDRRLAMTTDTGRVFGFGMFREGGGWADTHQGPLVRQDWLDAHDLPLPTTISDWDNTLEVFTEYYSAPLAMFWARFNVNSFVAGAFGAQGSTQYRLFIDRATDTVQLAQVQPEWRDYIEHMNMWWNNGWINQDLLTLADADIRTLAANDDVGLSLSALSQITLWTLDAEEAGSPAHWVAAPFPTADDGSISSVTGGQGITTFAATITNSVDDDRLELAMRVLDFAFSPEGHIYWNYGIEGVSWEMVNGEPQFSDYLINHPEGINEAMQRYVGTIWAAPAVQATNVIVARNHPVAIEANDLWFYTHPEVAIQFGLPRGMALNAQESMRAGEIEGAIQTYVNEMAVQFLTGAVSIDEFDSFVENVMNMGLEELLALYQAAYERFLARS